MKQLFEAILFGLPLIIHAGTTYYVSAETGSDGNDGLSWEAATQSIQQAIDVSSDGDSIIVSNGVYSPIVFGNRTIQSVNGPECTIVDGNNIDRCVSGSGTNISSIVGFWIRNGRTHINSPANSKELFAASGAGIRDTFAVDCRISDNTCDGSSGAHGAYGGGAYRSLLYRCEVIRNRAYRGGGGLDSVFVNCTVENNEAEGFSGAMEDGIMINCKSRGNRGSTTMCAFNSTLINCLVLDERYLRQNSWVDCSVEGCYSYNCTFVGNHVLGGLSANCLMVSRFPWSSDPTSATNCMKCELDSFVDAAAGDYRLVATSSAIDAGDSVWARTQKDLDGNPRISREKVDVGCYEFTTPITPSISTSTGMRFATPETEVSITSENAGGEIFYAINDGDYISANAQSTSFFTDETIHVRAYVLAHGRFQSEIVEADIVKVDPCAVVENVTATWDETETEVTLEWDAQPEAFTYAVFRNTVDNFGSAEQLATGLSSCSFVDAPSDSDVSYYYWVVGENELGPGQVGTATVTRWAQVVTPTISPENGTRFGTATKKVMFACATAGVKFHYTIDGSEPTTNSPSANAFTLRNTAMVKVIAVKSRMRNSEVASATITRVLVAAAPALVAVLQVGTGLRVAWGGVDDAESYEVFRGRSPDFATAQSLGETAETEWTDETAEDGIPYYYFVVSKNIAGNSVAGAPLIGATLTLATSVNAPQLTFTTGDGCPWTAVATNGASDGTHQATSGTPSDSAESWLETSVVGPGRLTFMWKASCERDDTGECEWDHLAFRVDGVDKLRLDGLTKWTEASIPIGGGDHILRWVYAKDEGLSEGADCGALDCVQWIPDETTTRWEKWIDAYGIPTSEGYETLKSKPSGKGGTLYDEYVAGLNPLDPLSRFRARIEASGSAPEITWTPDLGDARNYMIEGKRQLSDKTWGEPDQDSRFFRVLVKEREE